MSQTIEERMKELDRRRVALDQIQTIDDILDDPETTVSVCHGGTVVNICPKGSLLAPLLKKRSELVDFYNNHTEKELGHTPMSTSNYVDEMVEQIEHMATEPSSTPTNNPMGKMVKQIKQMVHEPILVNLVKEEYATEIEEVLRAVHQSGGKWAVPVEDVTDGDWVRDMRPRQIDRYEFMHAVCDTLHLPFEANGHLLMMAVKLRAQNNARTVGDEKLSEKLKRT